MKRFGASRGRRATPWRALVLLCAALAPLAGVARGSRPAEGGVTGTVKRHAMFESKLVAARNVDVWLPPGYERGRRRYPVLYMHDGQNVFDPTTSFGGTDWGIDETMTRLVGEGRVRAAIVVAVWNSPKRTNEYMPQKAVAFTESEKLTNIPIPPHGPIVSDDYLRFLVTELKPFVDRTYRTLPGRADTFVMGSSMGGLISAYSVSEYPNVFGGAGCLSTHWVAADGAVVEYLKTRLPDPRTHRLYFDYGTAGLDAGYEPFQRRMDEAMRSAGYEQGKNWLTRKFPGADHSEKWWRERAEIPLVFLLGK